MGTQTEIAKQIIDKKANYVLALKANHPTSILKSSNGLKLRKPIISERWFQLWQTNWESSSSHRNSWSLDCTYCGDWSALSTQVWAGLQSLVMVVRVRHLWNKTTAKFSFIWLLYSDAQLIGRAIRKHWGIENEAHWTLDCTFGEDACRIRCFHSPRNFAVLRRFALNANCEKNLQT